jgi:putative intracellular protease/amidase
MHINTQRPRVLVLMSQDHQLKMKDGSKMETGFYAEELAEPLDAFRALGADIVVATENGGQPVVDQRSLNPAWVGKIKSEELTKFVDDAPELKNPKSYADLQGGNFDAVLIPGGHIAAKLGGSKEVGRLLNQARAANAQIFAICHGSAALLAMGGLDGTAVTAFTAGGEVGTEAEGKIDLGQDFTNQGAHFSSSKGGPYEGYVVGDKGITTGQNPASAALLAQAIPQVMNGEAPEQFVMFSNHQEVKASPDEVFQKIGNFDTMAWHPGITQEGSYVDGGQRHLVSSQLPGVTFVENQLPSTQANTLNYQMVGGLPPNWQVEPKVELTVAPNEAGGSTVTVTRSADTSRGGLEALEGVSTAATGFDRAGLAALAAEE